MKILRRILRYLFLLAFIIVLGLAYYYRSLIFSEYINEKVDGAITGVLVMANIVPEQTEQEIPADQPTIDCEKTKVVTSTLGTEKTEVIDEPESEQARAEEPEQTGEAEPLEVDTGDPAASEPQDQAAEIETEQEESPIETLPPAADTKINEIDAANQAPTIGQSAVGSETESHTGNVRKEEGPRPRSELINQARLLHMTGNDSNSIDLYRELGELYPDDPNIFGELGNVFYLKGKWKQASLAYYEAALRLHKLRKTEQIHYLYLVIHGLDPETAEKLRGQIDS